MGTGASSEPQLEGFSIVNTKNGPIRSYTFQRNGIEYTANYSILYGEYPLPRFRKPEPKIYSTEYMGGYGFGSQCPRFTYMDVKTEIEEEMCLNLNIIAPKSTESFIINESLPVFVWINSPDTMFHVDFKGVYRNMDLANFFFTKGVLFITVNFRYGVVGFFTTGDDVCPGNMGLWDIHLALLWIKDNIGAFGGDANNITLCGQNSGGSIVNLLCLSPHTRDLFHKCVIMSGTATGPLFTVREKSFQVELSLEIARNLGWKGDDSDSEALIDFMRRIQGEDLFSWKCARTKIPQYHNFLPIIDGDFFPEPLSALRTKAPKKDIIVGILSDDGIKLNWEMETKVPYTGYEMDVLINEAKYGVDFEDVRNDVIQFYNGNIDVKNKKLVKSRHEEFLSDCAISNGALKYSQTMSDLGHVVFLFNIDKPAKNRNQFVEEITTCFTVFAKYGNPNGAISKTTWEQYSSENRFRYYNINQLESAMKDDFAGRRLEFWERMIYPRKRHGKQNEKE